MSDPTDASFYWGGPSYNPDPNAAKLQDANTSRGVIAGALGQLHPGQPAQFDASGADYWNAGQAGLANTLGAVASGQQQGAGELAVHRQIAQAQAAQQAQAASARGANAMLGAREAARQSAGLNLAGAGAVQQAALQDQTNARQLQAGVMAQGQQGSIATAMGQMQAQGMNQQQALAYLSAMTGIDQAELQARMQEEAIQSGSYQPGMIGQLFNAGSAAVAGIAGAGAKAGGA